MNPIKHSLSDPEEDAISVKRPRIDFPPPLPPEVWELIFRNLNAHWLQSVRLTCSTWNQIVSSSSRLMKKFVIKLTTNSFIKDRKQVRALLASARGYTQAEIYLVRIGQHKPRVNWFKPLGSTLHTLTIELGSQSTALFMQLLREMPNLKRLNIETVLPNFRKIVPDFQLNKLEVLSMRYVQGSKMLSVLRQMCPHLTALDMFTAYLWNDSDGRRELVAFISSVQTTLQSLTLDGTCAIVNGLIKLDKLRLTRLAINVFEWDCLRFIKHQPTLEHLELTVTNVSVINQILLLLPKLTTFKVHIRTLNQQQPLSLSNLCHIETLSVTCNALLNPLFTVNLSESGSTNLQCLKLRGCCISVNVLSNYGRSKITSMILEDCQIDSLLDVITLKSLDHFELSNANRTLIPSVIQDQYSNIRSLKVSKVNREVLLALLEFCPNLERFEAGDDMYIDEEILLEMTQRSQQLKVLSFSGCKFATSCLRLVPNHFNLLKAVEIDCFSFTVRKEVIEALNGIRDNVIVELRVRDMHSLLR